MSDTVLYQTSSVLTRSAHENASRPGWLAVIRSSIERSRQRTALRELAKRNDYLLDDIGVSQKDAFHEAAKSFWR